MIVTPNVNRLEPVGAPELYKTYQVVRPKSTHTREASCKEVDCEHFLKGWRSTFDLSTDLGKRQARYVRDSSGRHFEVISQAGGMLVLEFRAGQRCFSEHRVPLEREPLYRIAGGDWRGNPRGVPTITRSERDWVDDFGTHQQQIAEAIERG